MRTGIVLLLFAISSLAAEPVLVGSVRREKNLPVQLEKLAAALEQDFAVVLRGIGAEPVLESALAQKKPAMAAGELKSCASEDCARRILRLAGQKTMIVPVLERVRNSENLNVHIFRMQGETVNKESLLILFVNIEQTKRREALETVLLQSFPRHAALEEEADSSVSREERAEKDSAEKQGLAPGIHVVTDPGGADVYVDGRLAGQSPLEIRSTGEKMTLRISRSGYQDVTMPVRTSGRLELIVSLVPEGGTTDAHSYPYWGAFARSLLLPGLGQLQKGEKGKALLFGAGYFGAAGISLFNAQEQRRRYLRLRENYRQTDAYLYAASTNPIVSQLGLFQYFLHGDRGYVHMVSSSCSSQVCKSYAAARRNTRASLYTLGGIYIWSALDALFSGRPAAAARDQSVSWAGVPVTDSDRGFAVAFQVRF